MHIGISKSDSIALHMIRFNYIHVWCDAREWCRSNQNVVCFNLSVNSMQSTNFPRKKSWAHSFGSLLASKHKIKPQTCIYIKLSFAFASISFRALFTGFVTSISGLAWHRFVSKSNLLFCKHLWHILLIATNYDGCGEKFSARFLFRRMRATKKFPEQSE